MTWGKYREHLGEEDKATIITHSLSGDSPFVSSL